MERQIVNHAWLVRRRKARPADLDLVAK